MYNYQCGGNSLFGSSSPCVSSWPCSNTQCASSWPSCSNSQYASSWPSCSNSQCASSWPCSNTQCASSWPCSNTQCASSWPCNNSQCACNWPCCSSPCGCSPKPCFPWPPKNEQVKVNSASGSTGPLPTTVATPLAEPVNVVSTTIDTHCMCNTNNLLTFTGVITLPDTAAPVLNFQIRRASKDGSSIVIGPTYTFTKTATALQTETFGFQYMDEEVAPGFYTYSVEISTNSTINIAGCSVDNAVLSVVAVNA